MRTTLDIADNVLMAIDLKKPKSFYGFDPLPFRGEAVTNELIDRLREEDL